MHQVEGHGIHLSRGSLILVRPGIPHEYTEIENLEIFNLLFTDELINMVQDDLLLLNGGQLLFSAMPQNKSASGEVSEGGIRIPDEYLPEILELLELMDHHRCSTAPGIRTRIISEMLHALYLICSCCSWYGSSRQAISRKQLTSVLRQMRLNYQRAWKLEQLAQLADISVSSFRQQFKAMTGFSPMDYLIRLRIERGMELINYYSGQLSLSEIAWQCGFKDVNYFSRQFKRHYGESPRKVIRKVCLP